MTTIRVVLVDDHAIVRTGLKAVLGAAPEIEVVGEASGGAEATTLLAGTPADVVVMDISMADGDGITATRAITEGGAAAPRVLVLTMHAEEAYLEAVLEAGASGYLTKSIADRELVQAVRAELQFILALAPEGTRKRVARWRTGFYRIAERADIPIVPVSLDWAKREVTIGAPLHPTGDLDTDVAVLQHSYRREMARDPAAFWDAAP